MSRAASLVFTALLFSPLPALHAAPYPQSNSGRITDCDIRGYAVPGDKTMVNATASPAQLVLLRDALDANVDRVRPTGAVRELVTRQ